MNMATVTSDDPLATKDPSAAGDMLHSTRDRSEDCDPLSLSGGHLDRRFSLQGMRKASKSGRTANVLSFFL